MNIEQLISRYSPPIPWAEGDNIPWHDPEFSKRMLREHLTQDHDLASRRFKIIDRHVEWINRELLQGKKSRILDLGCGPGLYLQRLAGLGHNCVGIDYSPASIEYAIKEARKGRININYRQEDMRAAEFGSGYDLIMLVYGEFSVFPPSDAKRILKKAARSLRENGRLLLEVHHYDAIMNLGQKAPSWYSAQSGLFSNQPHLCLQENYWDETDHTATIRFFIIDSTSGEFETYAVSYQAYTLEAYKDLFTQCGFSKINDYPSLTGDEDRGQSQLIVFVLKK